MAVHHMFLTLQARSEVFASGYTAYHMYRLLRGIPRMSIRAVVSAYAVTCLLSSLNLPQIRVYFAEDEGALTLIVKVTMPQVAHQIDLPNSDRE